MSTHHELGMLDWQPTATRPDLVAEPVRAAVGELDALVAPIDAALAETAAFCAAYDVPLEASANCVVVHGRRAGESTYAAVVVLATMRADINGVVRRQLGVRKISFADQDDAVRQTKMAYGGITPVGLPAAWPVLVDTAVLAAGPVVIGSGLRGSKLLVEAARIAKLPTATTLDLALHSAS